jgi:outer membrane protein assembly factor BamE (lipoprotein component of BamABCDE complex)
MKKILYSILMLALIASLSGCGTVGSDFDSSKIKFIQTGVTTKQDVETLFGTPFKKGIQNGNPIWVYEYDQYRVIGKDASRDLVIVFDSKGVVKSYQIMSSKPII